MDSTATREELKAILDTWIPKYIRQVVELRSGSKLSAERYNELMNLLITQGDDTIELAETVKQYVELLIDDMSAEFSETTSEVLELSNSAIEDIAAYKSGMDARLDEALKEVEDSLAVAGDVVQNATQIYERLNEMDTIINAAVKKVDALNFGRLDMYESDLDTFAKVNGIEDYCTYMATVCPKTVSDGKYLFDGVNWTLIGMEYGNNTFGFQLGFSGSSFKMRRLINNAWGEWIQYTTSADLDELVERINSIQTTSKGTLSTTGWYRVAEITNTLYGSAFVKISVPVNSIGSAEEHVLFFNYTLNNRLFEPFSCKSSGQRVFTKIRYTSDGTKRYIEVYYAHSGINACVFSVFGQTTEETLFKAITPTLTSETASGVTVVTTYDIPANASPVTNLDLAKYLPLTGGTVNGNIEAEATDTSQRAVAVKNSLRRVSHFISTDGAYSVYDSTNGKNIIRSEKDGTNTFNGTATGNISKSGGMASNQIGVEKTDTSEANLRAKNTLGSVDLMVASNGNKGLYDRTNGKWIVNSTADGTVSLNGTASGNVTSVDGTAYLASHGGFTIQRTGGAVCTPKYVGNGATLGYLGFSEVDKPIFIDTNGSYRDILHTGNMAEHVLSLNGGGTVNGIVHIEANNWIPLKVSNVGGNTTVIQFAGSYGVLGCLGFNPAGDPIYKPSSGSGTRTLHHDGNSAKVHIGTSAPSDTSSLWIDTSE